MASNIKLPIILLLVLLSSIYSQSTSTDCGPFQFATEFAQACNGRKYITKQDCFKCTFTGWQCCEGTTVNALGVTEASCYSKSNDKQGIANITYNCNSEKLILVFRILACIMIFLI